MLLVIEQGNNLTNVPNVPKSLMNPHPLDLIPLMLQKVELCLYLNALNTHDSLVKGQRISSA